MINTQLYKRWFKIAIITIVWYLPLKMEAGVWRYVRNPPFGGAIQDVFCVPNNSVIWAVGHGWIGNSIDAGNTWAAHSITGDLWGVWFRDLNEGLACGYNGVVLKTVDGGNVWNQISVPTTDDLIRISFWDDSVGIIAGGSIYPESGLILRTTDFGETWQIVYTGDKLCTDVKCVPGTNCAWVSLTAPTGQTNVLKTTDRGSTWQEILIPGAFEYGYSIDAKEVGQTAWLAAWYFGNTKVYKTTNGGNSWSSYVTTDQVGPWEMKFLDASYGWLVCGALDLGGIANVLKTTDGGSTWVMCDHPGHEPLYSIAFLDRDTLVSAGGAFGGTVIRSTDSGINWYYVTQAEGINAFTAVDTEYIWAVGDYATILHSTDGGTTWQNQRALEPDIYGGSFWAVSFPNRNVGYVSGSAFFVNARTRKTTDGGLTWFFPVGNGLPNQAVTDLKFITPDLGWLLMIDGRIYKTTDGANNWVLQYQPSGSGDWDALDFVDSLYGWAVGMVGSQRMVIATTDGGTNWVSQTVPSVDWTDIDFINRNVGYAVGSATFIKTTDGGNNWNSTTLPSTAYGVGFGDSLCGWANGGSTIFHTTDGGGTFFEDTIETTGNPCSTKNEQGKKRSKYIYIPEKFSSLKENGIRYLYYPRVVAIDSGHAWCGLGQMNDGRILKYFASIPGVEEYRDINITSQLFKVSPNPFSEKVDIRYSILEAGYQEVERREKIVVSIKIYNSLGRLVKQFNHLTIHPAYARRGWDQPFNQIAWDGTDDSGRVVPEGVYFVRLHTPNQSVAKKVVKLK